MKFTKIVLILFLFQIHDAHLDAYLDYKSPFHPAISENGMVVSQNIESSEIGAIILESGGNAVDAAVAVGFSLTTTLPRAGNIGGGGFMLVYIKETKELFSIDYRSRSSLNSNLEDLFGFDFSSVFDEDDEEL